MPHARTPEALPTGGTRARLTLPLPNPDGTSTDTPFQLGAVGGLGPTGLLLTLTQEGQREHIGAVNADTGRYALPYRVEEAGFGGADTQRALAGLRDLLATDAGHDRFIQAVTSLDATALSAGSTRTAIFRRGQATAWAVAHHAPDLVRDALVDAARTWDGPIADLGQALLTAATPDA